MFHVATISSLNDSSRNISLTDKALLLFIKQFVPDCPNILSHPILRAGNRKVSPIISDFNVLLHDRKFHMMNNLNVDTFYLEQKTKLSSRGSSKIVVVFINKFLKMVCNSERANKSKNWFTKFEVQWLQNQVLSESYE